MTSAFYNRKQTCIFAFVPVEATLYLLLHCTNLFTPIVKYTCIALCFAFSLLGLKRSAAKICTVLALMFTMVADTFFVLCRPPVKTLAMCAFSVVALCYFIRLAAPMPPRWRAIATVFRTAVTASVLTAWTVMQKSADVTSTLSVIYFVNMVLNTLHACIAFRRCPCFALGLLLFICCDALIGLGAAASYVNLPQNALVRFAVANPKYPWLFYVPSQVLLAISSDEKI